MEQNMSTEGLQNEAMTLQKSLTIGIAALVYPEYALNILDNRHGDVGRCCVPKISELEYFLKQDGRFMHMLRGTLADSLLSTAEHFYNMSDSGLKNLLSPENKQFLIQILNQKILPSISVCIPNIIRKKFTLDTDQQVFVENSYCKFFPNGPTISMVPFIARQALLDAIADKPDDRLMKFKIEQNPEPLFSPGFVRIKHPSGIGPIYLDKTIMQDSVYGDALCKLSGVILEPKPDITSCQSIQYSQCSIACYVTVPRGVDATVIYVRATPPEADFSGDTLAYISLK